MNIHRKQLQLKLSFTEPSSRPSVSYPEHWLRMRFPLSRRHAALIAELNFGSGVSQ